MKNLFVSFMLFILFPIHAANADVAKSVHKPMRAYVEINGVLYELAIGRASSLKDVAPAEIQQAFRQEAKRFASAYIQDKLVVVKK